MYRNKYYFEHIPPKIELTNEDTAIVSALIELIICRDNDATIPSFIIQDYQDIISYLACI